MVNNSREPGYWLVWCCGPRGNRIGIRQWDATGIAVGTLSKHQGYWCDAVVER
jgi:hypothetical protein